MKLFLYVWVFSLASCIVRQHKKSEFTSASGESIQIVVPKRWSKVITTKDGAGGMVKMYTYSNGASFYVSNSLNPVHPGELIDTVQHIPLQHPSGARMFKGVMPGLLYWREVQKESYQVGYKNVPTELEHRFDSAVNFSLAKFKF